MLDNPNSPEQPIDLTGQTVGDYEILRRLGRGGMADVYLARQKSLQRNIALKVLKPNLARDSSYIERFNREAQSAARLVQANIVGVYEVGEINGLYYIAQEYVVGRNLREYVARHGAVKPLMAINVLRQVALALQKAAEHNVTHRDIKPENIMLSPSGEVKVADFGLARIDDENTKHLTQIGITMGTPLYMSPEQVEGQAVDVRSDIYSLGVTAYHMLAGYPPFDGENALSIAIQHVKNEPESLQVIRPDVPGELIALIEKMMAKAPSNRPQDAGHLLKSIKAIKFDANQDWDGLVETLAIENATTKSIPNESGQGRLEATRQLQSIMKGNVGSWWTELSTILGFVALLFTGLFIGLWFADRYPATDPLQVSYVAEGSVPKQESTKKQYALAVNYHPSDLAFFRAVIEYFPLDTSGGSFFMDRLAHDRAKERMAELHLINQDYEKAGEIYTEFEAADYHERLPIVGRAGLAIVLHFKNDSTAAKNKITAVESQVDGVLNQFLQEKFNDVRSLYFGNRLNSTDLTVDSSEQTVAQ